MLQIYSSILKEIKGDNMHPGTKQVLSHLWYWMYPIWVFFYYFTSLMEKTIGVNLAAKICNFHPLCDFHSSAVTCCRPGNTAQSFWKNRLRLFFFPVSLGLLLPMRIFVAGLSYFPRRRPFTLVSPPDVRLRVVHKWWRVCGAELFTSSAVM